MIAKVAFYSVLGKPLIMYLGLLALVLILLTAYIGAAVYKGKGFSVKTHKTIAGAAILVGLTHVVLSLGALFGF